MVQAQILKVCLFAAVGALFFGMDQSNWSGASGKPDFLALFCHQGGFDTLENCISGDGKIQSAAWANANGLMSGMLQIGAAIASLILAPILADRLGRKPCMWSGCLIGTGGIVAMCFSRTVYMMGTGRFILGMGVGLISFSITMYLSEVAPKEVRGAMSSLFQLVTVIGVVLAAALNLPESWPWWGAFVAPIVPAAILSIGLYFLPESPRFLLKKNKYDEALQVLTYLRCDDPLATPVSVQHELDEMEHAIKMEEAASAESTWSDLCDSGVWQRVVAAVGLQIFQQLTGINSVVTFGDLFFKSAGLTGDKAIQGVLLTDCANLLGTMVLLSQIDKFGRRSLLLLSSAVLFIGIFAAGIIGVTNTGEVSATMGWVTVGVVMLFQFGFGLGWGAIAWVYPSEIFNLKTKSKAMALSGFAQYMANFAIVYAFPNINKAIGINNVCFMFAGFIALNVVFVLVFVPETKGVALEDMDALFGSGNKSKGTMAKAKAEGKIELGMDLVRSDSLKDSFKAAEVVVTNPMETI